VLETHWSSLAYTFCQDASAFSPYAVLALGDGDLRQRLAACARCGAARRDVQVGVLAVDRGAGRAGPARCGVFGKAVVEDGVEPALQPGEECPAPAPSLSGPVVDTAGRGWSWMEVRHRMPARAGDGLGLLRRRSARSGSAQASCWRKLRGRKPESEAIAAGPGRPAGLSRACAGGERAGGAAAYGKGCAAGCEAASIERACIGHRSLSERSRDSPAVGGEAAEKDVRIGVHAG
jgi:hypothetical protein